MRLATPEAKAAIGARIQRPFTRVDPYLILLIALSSLALAPLAAPGYFYSAHDGRHSVFFITMFDEAIRSGALWPRWGMHHNMGYGYPTFLVQAPLAFYIAELFVLLGAGVTAAAKFTWGIAVLGGAWGMYALVKRWCSDGNHGALTSYPAPGTVSAGKSAVSAASSCGVVAGLLYTYAPYHLLDMYVRAALAETLLMTWFPWVILAFDRLIAYGWTRGWEGRLLLAAFGYGGLLLTHSFALPAFTPLLVGFILFRLWLAWYSNDEHDEESNDESISSPNRRWTLYTTLLSALAGIGGLLLAAAFLLPLVIEGRVLVLEDWIRETYGYERHWVFWGQFFSPFWGYGFSDDPTGANDGMGFQQGLALLLFAFLAAYIFINKLIGARKAEGSAGNAVAYRLDRRLFLMLFFLVAAIAILFTTTPLAAGVWRLVPLLEIIQFPWRLLAPAAFALSAVGGLVVWYVVDAASTVSRAHPLPATGREAPEWMGDAGMLVLSLVIVLASFDYSRPMDLQPIEPWREDGRAVAEFESEHPDMYGYTQYVEEPYAESGMQSQYITALEENESFDSNDLTRLVITAGEGEVVDTYSLGHAFGGAVEMDSTGTVQIQLLAFPGWDVRVDGHVVNYRVSAPYGLMEVDVPAGFHTIDVWMGLTWPRVAGGIVSSVTLLALVGQWWIAGYRKRETGAARQLDQ